MFRGEMPDPEKGIFGNAKISWPFANSSHDGEGAEGGRVRDQFT